MIIRRLVTTLVAITLGYSGHSLVNYTREDAHPVTAGTDSEWAHVIDDDADRVAP